MTYRILSLDGGGVRGLLVAAMLDRLEDEFPGFLAQFDLIAGTSTGGIIALGIAAGLTPRQMARMYQESGEAIFGRTVFGGWGRLFRSGFAPEPLREAIVKRIGDLRLGDLERKVLVGAFKMDSGESSTFSRSWKAKFFHNFPGADSDADELVVDVALRSSAAPTYFPIYQGYTDGGVVANNPAMCAVAQALHPDTGGQKIDDLILFSLGTGVSARYVATEHGRWGLLQWAPHLISLMLDGDVGLADYQCRQVLGGRYQRLNPQLAYPIDSAAYREMDYLAAVAATIDIRPTLIWLRENFA